MADVDVIRRRLGSARQQLATAMERHEAAERTLASARLAVETYEAELADQLKVKANMR